MSSTITKKSSPGVPVLVKAFAEEPARLTAVGRADDAAIAVYGTDPAKTVGFHNEDVFQYDEQLYRKLRRAFREGRADDLRKLWSKAVPVNPAEVVGELER